MPPTSDALAQDCARCFDQAKQLETTLHLPGVRELYRRLVNEAIDAAARALQDELSAADRLCTTSLLVQAHAARAEAARYGAGQMARSAQRAPTRADCEMGWNTVRKIVGDAVESATAAAHFCEHEGNEGLLRFVRAAREAAESARAIVDLRNDAFTFQSRPELSFGEGWYVAAAVLLGGGRLQVEPGTPQEESALRFLRDAGLAELIYPYRPRPASPKQATAVIADEFRTDPIAAQSCVRRAFLGSEPTDPEVVDWLQRQSPSLLGDARPKVLLWVRSSQHDPHRNTDFGELTRIARLAQSLGWLPVYFGDALDEDPERPPGVDLTLCWRRPPFQGATMRRRQLQLFELLRERARLLVQVGVTTAGMDGPALLGLPTCYLTHEPNVRLGKWVGAVPDYHEAVRKPGQWTTIEPFLVGLFDRLSRTASSDLRD